MEAEASLDAPTGPVPAEPSSSAPSRAELLWQRLKLENSVPARHSTVPSSEQDPSRTSAGPLSTPPPPSARDALASNSLKELLLGRVKTRAKLASGSTPRVFAGPLAWIHDARSDAKGTPAAAECRPAEASEAVPGVVAGDSSESRAATESTEAQREGQAGQAEPERITVDVAASALAAAKAAASLVVDNSNMIQVKEVRHFAGQAVEVTRFVAGESKAAQAAKRKAEMQAESSRGLDALLAQIEKKKKLNILDKTRKDWGEYKEGAGVVEELEEYKRSGATYTEKVAFLNRADVREYEKERDLRLSSRPSTNAAGR